MASVERCILFHLNVSHALMGKPIFTIDHKMDFQSWQG